VNLTVQAHNTASDTAPIVVLGIGNVLWADEGFGVRCVQALAERFSVPAHVTLVDGGTQGLYLLPYVESAHKLLIFDAIDFGLPPGTLHCCTDSEVPRYMGAKKLSLHQTGFQEVLALAELMGRFPASVQLIGAQPEVLDDFGGSLRPKLRAALETALCRAMTCLAAWGVDLSPRQNATHATRDADNTPTTVREHETPAHTLDCLSLSRYEAERPSEHSAHRRGDARFLQRLRTE